MVGEEPDEQLVVTCFVCKVPVLTWWKPNGGLLRGEYLLLGDEIFHPKRADTYLENFNVSNGR